MSSPGRLGGTSPLAAHNAHHSRTAAEPPGVLAFVTLGLLALLLPSSAFFFSLVPTLIVAVMVFGSGISGSVLPSVLPLIAAADGLAFLAAVVALLLWLTHWPARWGPPCCCRSR